MHTSVNNLISHKETVRKGNKNNNNSTLIPLLIVWPRFNIPTILFARAFRYYIYYKFPAVSGWADKDQCQQVGWQRQADYWPVIEKQHFLKV